MAGPGSPLRAKGSPGTRPMYRGSAGLSPQAGSSTPGWATPEGTRRPLLAGQLAVEAGQGNGKGLQRTQWVVVIHGEHVLCYTAKLHHNVVRWSQAQAWTETEGQSRDGGDGEGQTPKSQEGRESEKQRSQENPKGGKTDQLGEVAGEMEQVAKEKDTYKHQETGKKRGSPFRGCSHTRDSAECTESRVRAPEKVPPGPPGHYG